jgi:alkane 1-monooxygenase
MNKSFFNLQNKMIVYTIAHLLTLGIIFYFFGLFAMIAFVIAAIFGILLLETVNYIEHYGLLKK